MSARSLDPHREVLREVGQGLALPLPHRVRILRELSYDLESLTDLLVGQGISAEEAHRRAAEALVPDRAALDQLGRLHESWYRRRTRAVTPDRLRLVERGALALATATVLAVEGLALRRVNLFGDPSPFLVPVLVAGAVLSALVLGKAFELFIKGDHARPRTGLTTILAVAGATLALGVGGTVFDLYHLAGTLERTPALAGVLTPLWLGRSAVLMVVALILSMAGALGWFVLSHWVSLAEGAHREVLGLPHPSRLPRRSDHVEAVE
ncbi:MAG TPA: hypothetical protein VJ997_07090 [Longimicrobiales bacterium]|nr:hypothetical protein [Longimicrobiales bacterium]